MVMNDALGTSVDEWSCRFSATEFTVGSFRIGHLRENPEACLSLPIKQLTDATGVSERQVSSALVAH